MSLKRLNSCHNRFFDQFEIDLFLIETLRDIDYYLFLIHNLFFLFFIYFIKFYIKILLNF